MVKIKGNVKKHWGFTLIELLAVIIILGVLMIIAIPSVTKYINDSRKNGYVSTAKELVGGARNLIHSGALNLTDKDTTYYIDAECIKSDNGLKSPYGELDKAYVAIVLDGDNYEYYWMSVDSTNMGIATLKKVDDLDIDDIVGDIDSSAMEPNIAIDKRTKIVTIEGKKCVKGEPVTAVGKLNSITGKVKASCPAVTETIYWAFQNNDSANHYQKLVISDSPVAGEITGSFSGNTAYTAFNLPPWLSPNYYSNNIEVVGTVAPTSTAFWFANPFQISGNINYDLSGLDVCNTTTMMGMFTGASYESQSFNLDLNDWDTSKVTNIQGMFAAAGYGAQNISLIINAWDTSNITDMSRLFSSFAFTAPSINLNLNNWDTGKVTTMEGMFEGLGYSANTISLSINNWDTKNVTNMNTMFQGFGYSANSFNLNISNWNTKNVTSMSHMFEGCGYSAQTLTLNLNGWDTRNVTDMSYMFSYLGYNSSSFNLNINSLNTSKVTNMDSMFLGAAYNTTNFNLDLSNWDTGSVTNMNLVFCAVAHNSQTFNLNLSNWDTRNVTNMTEAFNDTGHLANTFNLDISNWNMSNVTRLSYMFDLTGATATYFNITIPRTNGNSINNTSSLIYGKTASISAPAPSGKWFTLAS